MRHLVPTALAGAAILFLACDSPQQGEAPLVGAAPRAAASLPVIDVTTATVSRGAIQARISASGSLLARRTSHIGAEVRGRILEVFVHEGDRVDAGDPLFQIDPKPFEVSLRQSTAGVDLARSERRQIEADLVRLNALHNKEIVSVDALERVKTQLAVAEARERQAAEAVEMARHNLQQTLVKAPFGGSISARHVDEGTTALVQPQTIVVDLKETAQLDARANIPESQAAIVQVGDPAQVYVEGLPGPIETQVSSVGDTIDPTTRTYPVEMLVPNEEHRLKAGVFARIEILPRAKREVALVPREAVRIEDGHTRVLVVREGRAEAVPVEIGIISDTRAEIISGVAIGTDVIVGDAAGEVSPGLAVRVLELDQGPAP